MPFAECLQRNGDLADVEFLGFYVGVRSGSTVLHFPAQHGLSQVIKDMERQLWQVDPERLDLFHTGVSYSFHPAASQRFILIFIVISVVFHSDELDVNQLCRDLLAERLDKNAVYRAFRASLWRQGRTRHGRDVCATCSNVLVSVADPLTQPQV